MVISAHRPPLIFHPLFCFPLLTFTALKINSCSCFLEIAWHLGRPCGQLLVIPVFVCAAAVDTCDVTWLNERGTGPLWEQTLMNSGLNNRLTLNYANEKAVQTRWWNCICSSLLASTSKFWQVLLFLITPQSFKIECIVQHFSQQWNYTNKKE